jgi:hypothetical protein
MFLSVEWPTGSNGERHICRSALARSRRLGHYERVRRRRSLIIRTAIGVVVAVIALVVYLAVAPADYGTKGHSNRKSAATSRTGPIAPPTSSLGSFPPNGICSHEGSAITGTLRAVGGPTPRADPVSGRVWATSVSRVLSNTGTVRCGTTVGRDGSYSLILPPGLYQLVGRSPNFKGGAGLCIAPRVVRVRGGPVVGPGGRPTVVNVNCERR